MSNSNSATHTPGPWVLFKVGGENGTVAAYAPAAEATKQSILTVTEEDDTVFAAVLDKRDARLIAAAPDLLAALLICAETIELKQVRAAIAKATGGEQ